MFRVLKQSIAKRSFDDIYNAGATVVFGVGTSGGYAYGAYAARETKPRLAAFKNALAVGTECALASAFVALTWPVSVPAIAYVAVTH